MTKPREGVEGVLLLTAALVSADTWWVLQFIVYRSS